MPEVEARPAPIVGAVVVPSRFVRPSTFGAMTGYSKDAISGKIKNGVWLEGFEYVRAPDGNILIDTKGYERWAAGLPREG